MDLSELQADAHLAINHMLLIKRSSDLERQWAIWDFEASLHQREAEAAATNERAKIVHLRKDLKARVKCAKVVMRAKYDYRVAIQEARAVRCSKLEEVEAAYLEALSENAAAKSLQCVALCREHAKYMCKLEEWALDVENKSHQDFLSAHQAVLCPCPSVPQRGSTFFLPHFIRTIVIITSIHSICQGTPGTGRPPVTTSPKPECKQSPQPKRHHSLTDAQGDTSIDESFPMALQEGPPTPREGRLLAGLPL